MLPDLNSKKINSVVLQKKKVRTSKSKRISKLHDLFRSYSKQVDFAQLQSSHGESLLPTQRPVQFLVDVLVLNMQRRINQNINMVAPGRMNEMLSLKKKSALVNIPQKQPWFQDLLLHSRNLSFPGRWLSPISLFFTGLIEKKPNLTLKIAAKYCDRWFYPTLAMDT